MDHPAGGNHRARSGCALGHPGVAPWTEFRREGGDTGDRDRGAASSRASRGWPRPSPANFADHGEIGAATAVYVDGRKVVDLWGGVADRGHRRALHRGHAAARLLHDEGRDRGLRQPARRSAASSTSMRPSPPTGRSSRRRARRTSRCAGCCATRPACPTSTPPVTYDEALAWDPVIRALEAQAPVWEPGTAHGYHATTYGWLVGEVVRRITGKSLGTFFAEEIAGPLDLEFWIGLPDGAAAPRRRRWSRSPSRRTRPWPRWWTQFMGPDTMLGKALGAPSGLHAARWTCGTDPRCAPAEIPAANGVTNARSLARFYAGLTGTVEGAPAAPLLDPEQIAAASERQTSGARPGASSSRPRSASASGRRRRSRPTAAPRPSATAAPVGRSGSPTRSTASGSAT